MLFSSPAFLFCFLPIFLLGWQALYRLNPGLLWLAPLAFSAIFYAFSGPAFFLFFCLYLGMNYLLGLLLARTGSRRALILALGLALAPLLWFKYSSFIAENLALLAGASWTFEPPGGPPGLSFITFIQIAWLCGVRQGRVAPGNLRDYALFSSFFAYVLSGPIVRFEQVGPQFRRLRGLEPVGLAAGFSLFSMGLAKKLLLADSLAPMACGVFSAAEKNWPLTPPEAWLGSLAYSFQLYFDFSGYTDMALGLGLMAGLRLPENFNSPYKATGIIEFWRRWHITLSLWLRDFLYIPLGGNRHGRAAQYRNLFLTMLIGGAWHGAGWTYLAWGGLHGIMLSVNHFFRQTAGSRILGALATPPGRMLCVAFTFVCLDLAWVIFRADSLEGALRIYRLMFSPDAAGWQAGLVNGHIRGWLPCAVLALCACIVFLLPNSHEQLLGQRNGRRVWPAFSPGGAWAAYLALMASASALLCGGDAAFLYFRF